MPTCVSFLNVLESSVGRRRRKKKVPSFPGEKKKKKKREKERKIAIIKLELKEESGREREIRSAPSAAGRFLASCSQRSWQDVSVFTVCVCE